MEHPVLEQNNHHQKPEPVPVAPLNPFSVLEDDQNVLEEKNSKLVEPVPEHESTSDERVNGERKEDREEKDFKREDVNCQVIFSKMLIMHTHMFVCKRIEFW